MSTIISDQITMLFAVEKNALICLLNNGLNSCASKSVDDFEKYVGYSTIAIFLLAIQRKGLAAFTYRFQPKAKITEIDAVHQYLCFCKRYKFKLGLLTILLEMFSKD